jgi:hypothetical protein
MSQVELKKVELELPKEAFEVKELLVALVKGIKEKKPIAELATSVLPQLLAAVEGVENLDDEAKYAKGGLVKLGALLAAEVVEIFVDLAPPAEVAAAPQPDGAPPAA